MRVYLSGTLPMLFGLRDAGELPAPITGFAVTPTLREWYASGDAEELEYAAFTDAARGSLRLLDADPLAPRRRVVLATDLPDSAVEVLSDLDRDAVRVMTPVTLSDVVSLHIDNSDAEADVRAAAAATLEAELGSEDAQFTVDGAEGHELAWYAVGELGPLLDLWPD
ncbi:MAG: hypothetical protein DLM59_07125 [Pseudonocardiales bacterium]|nr:MAG: hypothetical protein DLM59_07125 [Pseudonocardiales bacterium]